MQIITKKINDIDVSFKVSDDKKDVWILLDDNFALAEGYFCLRSMLSSFLRRCKGIRYSYKVNQYAKVDENGFFEFTLAKESKVLKEIVKTINEQS